MEALSIPVPEIYSVSDTGPSNAGFQWKLIREIMGPSVGRSTHFPYNSPSFELLTPVMEGQRQRLVEALLHTENRHGTKGSELWRMSGNLEEITDTAGTHRALDRVYLGPEAQNESEATREIGLETVGAGWTDGFMF